MPLMSNEHPMFSDGSGNHDADEVLVTIRQDSNEAPVAKIIQPGELQVTLHHKKITEAEFVFNSSISFSC